MLKPRWLLALILLLPATTAQACPFCSVEGKTLTQEVGQAAMVVYGTLENAVFQGVAEGGTTDLVIEEIIKPHEHLLNKKKLILNRYIELDEDSKEKKFLVFCDLYKGKVDAYRGMPLSPENDMPEYLAGALRMKDKKPAERLRFFFKYLDNPDFSISNDAYMEFGYASYADYRDMATELPADKIAGWLKDESTPSYKIGLYASMLGHCSEDKSKDSKLLKSLIESKNSRVTTGVDGILAALTMIDSQEGWAYLKGILGDPKKPFTKRYAALRALRFLYDERSDVVSREKLMEGWKMLLPQEDIVDLAVEDLRKRKKWELTDEVLALSEKESHDKPIIRRALLRFALTARSEKADKFVAEMRKDDAELVEDTEEILKLEEDIPVNGSGK